MISAAARLALAAALSSQEAWSEEPPSPPPAESSGRATAGGGAVRPGLEVSIAIDRCIAVPASEVIRITALELGTRVVAASEAARGATRVDVSCAGEHVRLRVEDPVTGKTLERTLALTAKEVDVRGRSLALAVTELLLTSWMELTLPEPPPASTGLEPPPPEARRAAEAHVASRTGRGARVVHLMALAELIGPFDGLDLGWGAGLRLGWVSRSRWLGADLDLTAARFATETTLGEIHASTWSLSVRASLKHSMRALFIDGGVGGRVGIARLTGTPADASVARGSSVAGTWAGPLAYAGGGVNVSHLAIALGVEAGYVLRGVSGAVDDGSPVALDGGWLAGSLALGWAP